ncbi:hypothetical protein AVEN_232197-1 [Araneus ventricosus]|uniref:Uncharacterized protein n=1 Tax=Araneus ventricosus TaxID=182803 RepID=A0A4Y2QTD4_ARAVE|nr:hypothetical protein AVEN_232197-1 [Araneus ventricosus]
MNKPSGRYWRIVDWKRNKGHQDQLYKRILHILTGHLTRTEEPALCERTRRPRLWEGGTAERLRKLWDADGDVNIMRLRLPVRRGTSMLEKRLPEMLLQLEQVFIVRGEPY